MKETENRVEPRECLDLNLKLLKLGSIFLLDETDSPGWINILYKGYTSFTVTLFFSVSVAAPFFFIYADYSLQDGIEVMSILLTQVRSGMKLMTFIIYRKEIQNLIRSLYENFYIHGRNLTAEESNIVREVIEKTRKMTICYVTLYSFTGLSMILQPLTSMSTELDQEVALNHTSVTVTHRSLPFKSCYPHWDSTKSPQYEIEYVAQAMLTALEAWCMGCIDTFCVTLMIYVGCQFDLLSISLKNMNKNVLLKFGIGIWQLCEKRIRGPHPIQVLTLHKSPTLSVTPEETGNKTGKNTDSNNCNYCLNKLYESPLQDTGVRCEWEEGNQRLPAVKSYVQFEREITTYITECIKHHQSLFTYVADMNRCFSTMFFVVFLTASLLICLLGFQVIVMPPKGLMFVRVFLHSLCTVFEIGFFCWFGSEVMHKSQLLYQAAYECEWQDHCDGAKQLVCMIIMRAQRPVAVRAGIFGELSLPTYSSLMKNAYSYLALLRQLHEGDGA